MVKCKCGCGQEAMKGKSYAKGHKNNPLKKETLVEEKQPIEEIAINVLSVQRIDQDNELAVFFDVEGTPTPTHLIEYMGIVEIGNQRVASVLILTESGEIVPPNTIEGFVGIYPMDTVFEDEHDTTKDENAEDGELETTEDLIEPPEDLEKQKENLQDIINKTKGN